ncbi:MAG: hypothetical protein ACREX3_17930 [Gammaproteobacteria bacterium]
MSYRMEIGQVAAANVEELNADLDQSRHALKRARAEVHHLERQVTSLEALLELARQDDSDEPGPPGLTLHAAMAAVLRDVPEQMLRAGDIAAEIDRRGLYKMRDGRPVEAQQIHARVGHYPHFFTKVGTFIKLLDGASI